MKCESGKKKLILQKLSWIERFNKGELIMLLIRCKRVTCKRLEGNYKSLEGFYCSWVVS